MTLCRDRPAEFFRHLHVRMLPSSVARYNAIVRAIKMIFSLILADSFCPSSAHSSNATLQPSAQPIQSRVQTTGSDSDCTLPPGSPATSHRVLLCLFGGCVAASTRIFSGICPETALHASRLLDLTPCTNRGAALVIPVIHSHKTMLVDSWSIIK